MRLLRLLLVGRGRGLLLAVRLRLLVGGWGRLLLVGGLGPGAERIYECGVSGLFALPDGPASLSDLMERAPELYLNAARRMFRILRTGCDLAKKD